MLPARRYWSAFNESSQTLEFYPSERDLISHKAAVESISLHRAAITLSTTEERAFIILYVHFCARRYLESSIRLSSKNERQGISSARRES